MRCSCFVSESLRMRIRGSQSGSDHADAQTARTPPLHPRAAPREPGVPPSFDEMKDALDLRSKSGIHRLIMALEERGFIRRLPNRARALEVIRLPEGGRGRPAPVQRRASSQRGLAERRSEGARPRRGCAAAAADEDAAPVMRSRSWGGSRPARRSRRSRTKSHTITMSPDFARQRRALRPRSARRFDGRGRHPRRRHRRDPQAGHAPIPATSSSR